MDEEEIVEEIPMELMSKMPPISEIRKIAERQHREKEEFNIMKKEFSKILEKNAV